MIEEIVTAVEPSKTKKTEENEALTLHLGEEAATYVTDQRTRQKLLDLLTAKLGKDTAKAGASAAQLKASISQVAIMVLLVIVVLVGGFIMTKNTKTNDNSKKV